MGANGGNDVVVQAGIALPRVDEHGLARQVLHADPRLGRQAVILGYDNPQSMAREHDAL